MIVTSLHMSGIRKQNTNRHSIAFHTSNVDLLIHHKIKNTVMKRWWSRKIIKTNEQLGILTRHGRTWSNTTKQHHQLDSKQKSEVQPDAYIRIQNEFHVEQPYGAIVYLPSLPEDNNNLLHWYFKRVVVVVVVDYATLGFHHGRATFPPLQSGDVAWLFVRRDYLNFKFMQSGVDWCPLEASSSSSSCFIV